jgi:hypothetical protein
VLVGSFDELAVDEHRAGTYQRDQMRAFTARHRVCADSISLNAIATHAIATRYGGDNPTRAPNGGRR